MGDRPCWANSELKPNKSKESRLRVSARTSAFYASCRNLLMLRDDWRGQSAIERRGNKSKFGQGLNQTVLPLLS